MHNGDRIRCDWASSDALLARYHDEEWGHPPASDDAYFEVLMLEIFQAGLSWKTVLYKREGFRRAFMGFSIPAVAEFTPDDVERLMADPTIIRNRRKIDAAVANARALQDLQREYGSFAAWLRDAPADPDVIYRSLRSRLSFFGPTICESFLQAVGKIPAVHDPHCWKASI